MLSRSSIAKPLFVILLISFSVRALCIFFLPKLPHPDETFQLLEPAHQSLAAWRRLLETIASCAELAQIRQGKR